MSDMKYARNFHVFRQRDEGVWVYMGEQRIQSTRRITGDSANELVVRSFMGTSKNAGGVFAVVPSDEWKLVDARQREPEVKPSSASMVPVTA